MGAKKKDEFGSQANLVDNEAETATSDSGGDKGSKKGPRKPMSRSASLKRSSRANSHEFEAVNPGAKVLTPDEKIYLLNVERGDLPFVRSLLKAMSGKPNIFDINCVDPLGRSALVIAIENENLDLMQILLESGILIRDALLVAIREDYVDGVETLLIWEEEHHTPDTPYSWESIDQVTANFTPDMTPLILAAQRNNYEILKLLLDRGANIPMPHDVKCSCEDCLEASKDDSLRFSLARINAYKALASPSMIALSSKDPINTAFDLASELKRLSYMEAQFKDQYKELRTKIQGFVTSLIDQARTSYELEILLNYNPEGDPWHPGNTQTLGRLQLAIKGNQKTFVTNPSVQQLLASIWYDGLPGFRRMHIARQMLTVAKIACMFPLYAMMYIIAPNSPAGKLAKKPFVKFICHSASYMIFLTLLAAASQQIDKVACKIIVFFFPSTTLGEILSEWLHYWETHERGSFPTILEIMIMGWVQTLIWAMLKTFYKLGFWGFIKNLWNLADAFSYGSFQGWIALRALSWLMVQKELMDGYEEKEVFLPRKEWHVLDPYLLAEAMFSAGMIASFLKLINIFSINPYLGPLQVSLGKMIVDICKWLVLFILVLFSFGCGLNQLMWYYAEQERINCFNGGDEPDFNNNFESCVIYRRFANLWETSQSLFWASFGLVDLESFDLMGIKEFTRFWALLMFGSYSVCNIIVLLNMLIAMMSNSYTIISEKSDMEWKFARSKLWISYFKEGSTVPPPFNVIPTPKSMLKPFTKAKKKKAATFEQKIRAENRYLGVVRCLVRRHVTEEQRKDLQREITEDDINEVRQDIRSFRFDLINILKTNDFKTPKDLKDDGALGRKSKDLERKIQKGFNIAKVDEGLMDKVASLMAKGKKGGSIRGSQDSLGDPIGSKRKKPAVQRKAILLRANSVESIQDLKLDRLDQENLIHFNPKLEEYPPTARSAYAKFRSKTKAKLILQGLEEEEEAERLAQLQFENEAKTKKGLFKGLKGAEDKKKKKAGGTVGKKSDLKQGAEAGKQPDSAGKSAVKKPPVRKQIKDLDRDLKDSIDEEDDMTPAFNPNGVSQTTGKAITGWI